MSKSNHIVCGYEPSSGGDAAAAAAAILAPSLGCRTVLVHVARDASSSVSAGLSSLAEARQRQELRAVAERHGLPTNTSVHVASGDPAEALVRVAGGHDAELIVVGSRGLLELGSVLLGSVSCALMGDAPCPVVVVPPEVALPSAPGGIRSLICGVEGSERDAQLLRLSADLAHRLAASLHAVHAFEPGPSRARAAALPPPLRPDELPATAHAMLKHALGDSGVRAQARTSSQFPVPALAQAAVQERAGLIVVASQGRGKLGSILHGSVTVQLAAMSPVPVLVLPPRAELAAGSGHYELAADAA